MVKKSLLRALSYAHASSFLFFSFLHELCDSDVLPCFRRDLSKYNQDKLIIMGLVYWIILNIIWARVTHLNSSIRWVIYYFMGSNFSPSPTPFFMGSSFVPKPWCCASGKHYGLYLDFKPNSMTKFLQVQKVSHVLSLSPSLG